MNDYFFVKNSMIDKSFTIVWSPVKIERLSIKTLKFDEIVALRKTFEFLLESLRPIKF